MCNGKTVIEPEGCENCPEGGYCDACFYRHSEACEHRAECRCGACVRWSRILAARIHEANVCMALRRAAAMLSGAQVTA
jgi:hypothetical protein